MWWYNSKKAFHFQTPQKWKAQSLSIWSNLILEALKIKFGTVLRTKHNKYCAISFYGH